MQSQLLVGPTSPINGSDAFSSIFTSSFLISSPLGSGATATTRCSRNRSSHRRLVVASSSSAQAAAVNGEPDHYKVLGVARTASSADIKRAYRLLARKYHPDVSKESRAAENFKTVRSAYEVLSDEVTRTNYDQALKFGADNGRSYGGNRSYSTEFEDGTMIYKWAELRRKMKNERYGKDYYSEEKNSAFYGKTSGWEVEEENLGVKRGSFSAVLRSAFIYLFLLMVFGSQLSLTFSSLMALFDEELDGGYKIGYSIAWILGGRGGVLLTLCLSFASWLCGKTSSDAVVLVVLAMWVGSNLARYAPVPQGALIALLCMSLKLQTDTT